MMYIFLSILVVTSVSAWILTFRMRRRVKKALGGNATKANLTSLNTWMAVDEAEKRKRDSGPLNPK